MVQQANEEEDGCDWRSALGQQLCLYGIDGTLVGVGSFKCPNCKQIHVWRQAHTFVEGWSGYIGRIKP